ncbi:MAG: hypothetical protein JXB49_25415 [Bacteroidales bacterium]|nr:hypothetical protein [Bacteroidales bacterium]
MASQVKQIRRRKQLKKQQDQSEKRRGFRIIEKKANGAILNLKQQEELYQYYMLKGISIIDNSPISSERNYFGFYKMNGNIQFCKVTKDELDYMKQMFLQSSKLLKTPVKIITSDSFTIHCSSGDYLFLGKYDDIEKVLKSMESEMKLWSFILNNNE